MEEETKNQNNTTNVLEKIKEETEKVLKAIGENGIQNDNVDLLGKIVDIHKDIANEEYWKGKEEYYMRYRESSYGNYGEDSYGRRRRDSRGRYMGDSSYGRRGVKGTGRGRYRGEEMLDEMYSNYQDYNDGREEYNNSGNYGAKDDSVESLDRMLKGITEFMVCLKEDADSEEEMQLIKKYSKKISEM